MNECFLMGTIIKKVEFEFLYCDKKHISIAKTEIELSNQSIIHIYGYDEMADKMLQKIKEKEKVLIYGKLEEEKIKIRNFITF